MCLIERISLWQRTVLRLAGVIQFSCTPTSLIASFFYRICCLPLFLTYFFCTFLWWNFIWGKIKSSVLTIHVVISSMGMIFMVSSLVSFYQRSKTLKSLFLKLDLLETTFSPLSPQDEKDWYKISMLVVFIVDIILLPGSNFTIVFFVYFFFPVGVAFFNYNFLDAVLEDIRRHFKYINLRLEKQVQGVDFYHIFPFTKAAKIQQLEESEKLFNILQIQELSHLHYDLVEIALQFNRLFDVTTVTSLTMWFGYVVDTVYVVIHALMEDEIVEPKALISTMLNLFFFFVWLFVIVRMYTYTEEEANRTSRNVHELWNKYYMKEQLDEKVRHLQLISTRMLNAKLHFTARNFFALDRTFIHMMIGAVTTYLVILVQFRV